MGRITGVAASRMVAGLQILFGYFSVAPRGPEAAPTEPILPAGRRRSLSGPPAPEATDVTFSLRPPSIRNEVWLVFRGTSDRRTGHLVGEIVPDVQMRVLGLAPVAAFAIGGVGAMVALVLVPFLRGGQPSLFAFAWATSAMAFSIVWIRACGAAVHDAASNVRRDSPDVLVAWHPGFRSGSRSTAPPPQPQ